MRNVHIRLGIWYFFSGIFVLAALNSNISNVQFDSAPAISSLTKR